MILYYIVLILILWLLLKYNNPSINNRDLCVFICLAIVLLFIMIKIRYLAKKCHKKVHIEETIAKPEMRPEMGPEMRPEMRPEMVPEMRPEMKPEMKPETRPEMKPEMVPEEHNINNKCGQIPKIPKTYTLTSVNEDYVLSGGLEYDLNNPKYPLLEQNQDIQTFPSSFGEIDYIIDKYRDNGENPYESIYYNIPDNMSYNNVGELMNLNKIRSLSQQSPLV